MKPEPESIKKLPDSGKTEKKKEKKEDSEDVMSWTMNIGPCGIGC